jgi:type II secretory pathway pseudopilin PulG
MKGSRYRNASRGFTAVELIVGLLLFSVLSGSVLIVSKGLNDNGAAAGAASRQNAYATFQSQVALQGIDPSLVGNPLESSIQQAGSTGTRVSLGANTRQTVVRHQIAGFEVAAVSRPAGAERDLPGSARVRAINYSVAAAGAQSARGSGIGFAIDTVGTAPVINAITLAPPSFNVVGDLTYAVFPLNDLATLPKTNPPGTVYRYTLDGTTPTDASMVWDNNPNWAADTFPAQVTLRAFNSDPDYAPSFPVSASFTMQIVLHYGRADGRTANIYGFTWADLQSPSASGIVLSGNIPNLRLLYSLDGSDPAQGGTLYTGPFAPAPARFNPTALLKITADSSDPRFAASGVSTYTLVTITTALAAPVFVTSNASPLTPGTPVVLSVTGSSSPRTEINNGAPAMSSSSDTQFPLN